MEEKSREHLDERAITLLFGENTKISLRTIDSFVDRGFVPLHVSKKFAERWKKTFVGTFLLAYPQYHGVLQTISDVIGKTPDLSDFTATNLEAIVGKFKSSVSPGTAKKNASMIKTTITRMLEDEDCKETIPCKRYAKILSLDSCPTTKPYLNVDDVKKFLKYEPQNISERNCKAMFAVMLMTGARISDVLKFKRTNIQNGVLTYVPQKTKHSGTVVSIPVSDLVISYIEHLEEAKCEYSTDWFNKNIKQMCQKCGLTEEVTYFWGGKYVTKPKYEAMRSHLGRTSFVTNMLKLGQQIHEVSKMAGHTDIAMTSRYNASTDVKLTDEANEFINMKLD